MASPSYQIETQIGIVDENLLNINHGKDNPGKLYFASVKLSDKQKGHCRSNALSYHPIG